MIKMKTVQLKFRYYVDLPDGTKRFNDSAVTETVDATDYYDGFGTGQIVIGIRAYQ
jgi:hypothetical protein